MKNFCLPLAAIWDNQGTDDLPVKFRSDPQQLQGPPQAPCKRCHPKLLAHPILVSRARAGPRSDPPRSETGWAGEHTCLAGHLYFFLGGKYFFSTDATTT